MLLPSRPKTSHKAKLHVLTLSMILASVIYVTIGCSGSTIKSYPSLANQGILPLSTTNAYVAGNLFLAREAELSPFLFNFLKSRGGPAAIEIFEDNFSPAKMLLFYPREREVFAAYVEEAQAGKTARQWLIKGPYTIDRKDYRNLASLEASINGEPLFVIRGRQQRFRFEPQEKKVKSFEPVIPNITLDPPKNKHRKTKAKPKESEIIVKHADKPTEFKPLNSDQQAIQMSLGFVERGLNGDAIHTVKAGETLEAVAKWYTGAEINSKLIAEANSLNPNGPLLDSMKIIIPLKLLKTTKAMPAK